MELSDAIYQMIQQSQKASQPTDLCVGTVTSAAPLEITINTAMAPLRAPVLYLTSAVIEKKISALSHKHTVGGESTDIALDAAVCLENGVALPADAEYITINRALKTGDHVLLLRVQSGQKFIVLSRIF